MKRAGYSVKLLRQFIAFSRENRVYWIVPLVLMLAVVGFLITATEAATPLIYALF